MSLGHTNRAEGLIEEGEAFAALSGLAERDTRRAASSARERFDVVVIGGGQAGLSIGYHLQKRGLRFAILDASARIGDAWRTRWDSLRLFSIARFDALDGLPFPGPQTAFPTKDEMADYLESYAAHFRLPVQSGVRVERVWREGDRYKIDAGARSFDASHVVVAMGHYQGKKIPAFARELSADIVQLHSLDYRSPSQLPEGAVLIAGAGNSGAEIAFELARSRRTLVSGPSTGQVPFRPASFLGRNVLQPLLFRIAFHRVLHVSTPIGRKLRPQMLKQATPLIRTRAGDLSRAGVERVSRTVGVKDGKPVLEDGRVLDVASVVWCTGFGNGLSWLDLPVFEKDGEPRHVRGVVDGEPGLYFVGQHFQTSMSSGMIHGVGRDAARIAAAIRSRVP